MTIFRVYEADDTPNSDWQSAESAAALCASHPGWYWSAFTVCEPDLNRKPTCLRVRDDDGTVLELWR